MSPASRYGARRKSTRVHGGTESGSRPAGGIPAPRLTAHVRRDRPCPQTAASPRLQFSHPSCTPACSSPLQHPPPTPITAKTIDSFVFARQRALHLLLTNPHTPNPPQPQRNRLEFRQACGLYSMQFPSKLHSTDGLTKWTGFPDQKICHVVCNSRTLCCRCRDLKNKGKIVLATGNGQRDILFKIKAHLDIAAVESSN